MDRRQALKNIGVGAGFLVATPTVISLLQSCTNEPEFHPVFLTEGEGHALRRMVDLIIPSDRKVPGAVDVGVHSFIDAYWKEVLVEKEQVHIRKGFQLFADEFRNRFEKELETGKAKEFDMMLADYFPKTLEEQEELDKRLGEYYMAYATDPTVQPNSDDAIAGLLTSIRGMTIWGWKSSEEIGKNVLWYDPVPGVYQGCVPIEEAGNGNAMAL